MRSGCRLQPAGESNSLITSQERRQANAERPGVRMLPPPLRDPLLPAQRAPRIDQPLPIGAFAMQVCGTARVLVGPVLCTDCPKGSFTVGLLVGLSSTHVQRQQRYRACNTVQSHQLHACVGFTSTDGASTVALASQARQRRVCQQKRGCTSWCSERWLLA